MSSRLWWLRPVTARSFYDPRFRESRERHLQRQNSRDRNKGNRLIRQHGLNRPCSSVKRAIGARSCGKAANGGGGIRQDASTNPNRSGIGNSRLCPCATGARYVGKKSHFILGGLAESRDSAA